MGRDTRFVPLALIELNFDPLLHLGGLTIRWQTLGVTGALLVALAMAALMAPDVSSQRPFFRRREPDQRPLFPHAPKVEHAREIRRLRLDDMLLIVAAIVPGAVVGGRLFHALDFWSYYSSQPLKLFDPLVGTLSLLGAVLGGLFTAAYVARVIGAPVRRWADAAAVPLLLLIGLGKLAQLLGGSGQGLPFDGSWAVAFVGDGPWVSASPAMPAHPSQVYEGLWLLAGIPIVLMLAGRRRRPLQVHRLVGWTDRSVREGALFAGTMAWFLLGRFAVGFTWRDDRVAAGLNVEQALALGALMLAGLVYGMARLNELRRRALERRRRRAGDPS
jgi:prolipoprotein diacylglyceryltransferase